MAILYQQWYSSGYFHNKFYQVKNQVKTQKYIYIVVQVIKQLIELECMHLTEKIAFKETLAHTILKLVVPF